MSTLHSSQLAPVLGARLDGERATTSTSDLLVTIFGELMRPPGGSAWTQTLVESLSLFEVEEKAARQAISRLAAKGWIESERVGRRTRWTLTPWANDLLTRGADRIYGLGKPLQRWDQQWLVLLASVPESRRSQRTDMSVGLGWAGFGSLGNGVWICPWTDRETEATKVLADAGVNNATMFRSTMTEVGDASSLAQRAWPHEQIAAEYKVFVEAFVERFDSAAEPAESDVRLLIELVHAWRQFPLLDPGLPAELLGDDWVGNKAAQLFTTTRARLEAPAQEWWAGRERHFGK